MNYLLFLAAIFAAAALVDYFSPQAKARREALRAAGVRGWWRVGLLD